MKKNWMLHLMALPAIIAIIVFSYIPKVGILMAFQKIDLQKGPYTSPDVMEQLASMPTESTQMAITFLVSLPLLVAYPFFQKYFVKGMTIGSVKG